MDKPKTDPTKAKPGNYPLGSAKSRAAARALMGQLKSKETAIQVVYVSPDGTRKNGPLLRFPAPTDPEADQRAVRLLQERMKRYKSEEKQSATETCVEYHKV